MKKFIYCITISFFVWDLIPVNSVNNLFATQKANNKILKSITGDSITVTHAQGNADANVYVVVEDSSQLIGSDYEVFFNQQTYYRNENGEWVPIPLGRPKDSPTGADTLTGSTIDIGAVYGPAAGVIELACHLNLVSPDYNWADGISMTFPSGITIIETPPFEAGGGWVYPEIVGNTLNMGIVNGPPTGNGIFWGEEDWTIFISSFQPPLIVDWIIYDDGYSGGTVNAVGSTTITEIGYAFKTEDHWNVLNITTQDTVLEDQTVIMGYDLYTGEYVGDPIVEGFKISVNCIYDDPITIGNVEVNGTQLNFSESDLWWVDDNFVVCDFTRFGYPDGTAATTLPLYGGAGGTTNISLLEQDYEFRWTGVLTDTIINGNSLTITQSGGSIATLFGASQYSLADHPLNPNPGLNQAFTVRIPVEVWNADENQQVNLVFWDRSNNPAVNGGEVWNRSGRVYTWIVNTSYSTNSIDITSQIVADNATWNVVYYLSDFTLNDLINITYYNPIQFGVDLFNFTTPEGVVSVDDETIPARYQVFQNYPNPFNPSTKIKYSVPQSSNVVIKVFDILGKEIETLVNEEKPAGAYEITWYAEGLPSGVYFYQLKATGFAETKKMILMK